jgi:hypothetical protein
LLGDFNAKVGKEHLCENGNDNVVREESFAISKNVAVKSTIFPHCKIYKYTWTSPDDKNSQIDHIMPDRR